MNRFLALDFETGGLDPRRNAPASIGCCLFTDGQPGPTFETLIGPTYHWKTGKLEREYTVNALQVSGITWKQLLEAPKPALVVTALESWMQDHEIGPVTTVAFNANFDLSFYSELLNLAGGWHPTERGKWIQPTPPIHGPWQCAMIAARRSLKLAEYSLDSVAAHYGLMRTGDKHGALEDAILAGQIWTRLC